MDLIFGTTNITIPKITKSKPIFKGNGQIGTLGVILPIKLPS